MVLVSNVTLPERKSCVTALTFMLKYTLLIVDKGMRFTA